MIYSAVVLSTLLVASNALFVQDEQQQVENIFFIF
jgi:hypothetical protein